MENDDQKNISVPVSTPKKVGRPKKIKPVLTSDELQKEKDVKNAKRRTAYAIKAKEKKDDEASLKSDLSAWLSAPMNEDEDDEIEEVQEVEEQPVPVEIVIPKNLVPENEDKVNEAIENVTKSKRARKLREVKDKSATSVLPKNITNEVVVLPNTKIQSSANDGFAVWKSNRNPNDKATTTPGGSVTNNSNTTNNTSVENNTSNVVAAPTPKIHQKLMLSQINLNQFSILRQKDGVVKMASLLYLRLN